MAKEAIRTKSSVRDLVIRNKLLTKEQLDTILDPFSMTEPGISGIDKIGTLGGVQ